MTNWKHQGRGNPPPDNIGWLRLLAIWAVAFAIAGVAAWGIAG